MSQFMVGDIVQAGVIWSPFYPTGAFGVIDSIDVDGDLWCHWFGEGVREQSGKTRYGWCIRPKDAKLIRRPGWTQGDAITACASETTSAADELERRVAMLESEVVDAIAEISRLNGLLDAIGAIANSAD